MSEIPDITPEQRSEVVYALLKVGVPPTAIAKALGMEADHVKTAQGMMRVEKYGTDEKSEAMDHLIWEAYEESLYQIRYGTPANKSRFIQMVLARAVGLAGKSAPETSEKIRAALDELARGQAPEVRLGESIYTPTE